MKRLAALACVAAAALGGCLGGDGEDNRESAYPDGFEFAVKESLVPAGFSAGPPGRIESYEPRGELIADSGFRPQVDGYAFENYGNDAEPRNLGPQEMVDLFGEQVCISGSGGDCVLVPAAQQWMENQNAGMAGGHCEGFSMSALAMYDEDIAPDDFGAELPAALEIVGNSELQATIAEHFVYQLLPSVLDGQVHGAPSEIVDALVESLESGDEHYTLGIYKPDGSGGHAITPFAVEDRGGGRYAILVYDNNFPGATRAVQVNANSETWRYVGGTNPRELGHVYEGDATTGTLELDPLSPGQGAQPCPFCAGEAASASAKGDLLPEDEQYTEITLEGDPTNHPHLVFEDGRGRRTGIVGGRILEEIPDVEVVKTYATENWAAAPEPRFRLPEGKEYTITVDGSDLTKPTKANVDLIGNGLVIEVEDIELVPGQQDAMALPGGYGITYGSDSKKEVAPNFFIGLVEDDAAYNFAGSAVGLKRGSAISLVVEQEEKVMYVDSTGSEGSLGGKGIFILNLTRGDADGRIAQWQADDVRLNGAREEKAGFEYGTTPKEGKPLPLVILDANAEPKKVVRAAPQTVEQ